MRCLKRIRPTEEAGRETVFDRPRAGSRNTSSPGKEADRFRWRCTWASLTSLTENKSPMPRRESDEGTIIPGTLLAGVIIREERRGGRAELSSVSYPDFTKESMVGCLCLLHIITITGIGRCLVMEVIGVWSSLRKRTETI